MNAIEAMARAIWSAAPTRPESYDELSGFSKARLEAQARAALTALRDNGVTEGMYAAWVDQDLAFDEPDGRRECANEFRAMLDAALQEDSVANGR